MQSRRILMARFHVRFDRERCKGCQLCLSFCPKKIIKMSARLNSKGYAPAGMADEERCIGCQSCALVCPDGAIAIFKEEVVPV
jgi:2-oxoglutarate ferredoxin oxidoreductase subunit delta